jgi:hypothetical protein
MRNILIASIFITLLMPLKISSASSDKQVKKFAYDSLRRVIVYSLEKNLSNDFDKQIADPSGLIILLSEVDTSEARNILLQLIEVNIGDVHAEALTYSILRQGKKIKSNLSAMVTKPIQCSLLHGDFYDSQEKRVLRCFTQQERDTLIINLLRFIDEGTKPSYDL